MSDLVNRLEAIKNSIETLKDKKIRLEERAKKEEETFLSLIKQIKDMGFDPKTLKDDLINMEKDLNEKVEAKEKEVEEIKTSLEDIERNVEAVLN